ncbi:GntR family transcriptional regulator [Tatumella sp. OPLPL6]|nr:GntR family transcriptional regulator [Tatumella sp. OPLPL6]
MHIYERIMAEITNAIYHGQLLPGSRVPSVRTYALNNRVSLNSVKTAYRLLEDKGLIFARPQSGYFVCESLPELKDFLPKIVESNILQLSGMDNLLAIILEYQREGRYIDLALACPVGESFYPLNRLRKLTTKIARSAATFTPSYTMPAASPKLSTQIARRGVQLGMHLCAEDILITHGTMEALNIAVRAATCSGDSVVIETPSFFNLYPMLEHLGRKIINIPTHPRQGMCLDSLEELIIDQNIKAVITIPSGHNPLGFSMPIENRRRLAEMAARHHFAVIEDAMYAELQFTTPVIPNIKAFDKEGWVMICASYTKTVAPDFRLGWLEAGRFRKIAHQMKFTTSVAESSLLSEILGEFLENGSYDLHLRHLKRLYVRQIDTVRACIANSFPRGTHVSRPQGGFILWIEMPKCVDAIELFHSAIKENIICMPGVVCSRLVHFSHCLRLAVCFILDQAHRHAIKRLGELACIQYNDKNNTYHDSDEFSL